MNEIANKIASSKTRMELENALTAILKDRFDAKLAKLIFFDESKFVFGELLKIKTISKLFEFLWRYHSPVHEAMVMTQPEWRKINSRFDHGHVMAGPVVGGGLVTGIIGITRGRDQAPFSSDEVRDLGAICSHVSSWRENEFIKPATERELELVRNLAAGRTNFEIGVVMGISENGVKQALKRMFRKYRVSSRAALVAKFGHWHNCSDR